MLFHPKTLKLLYQFKLSGADLPSLDILALLTDYTSFIKISDLFSILFSYTGKRDLESLKNMIITNTRAVTHEGISICIWPTPPCDVKNIILQNRTGTPRHICLSSSKTERCNYILHLEKMEEGHGFDFFNSSQAQECQDFIQSEYANVNQLLLKGDFPCQCAKKRRTRRGRSIEPDVQVHASEPDAVTLLSSQADSNVVQGKRRRVKTGVVQSNILNFQKMEAKQIKQIEKFSPVDLSGCFFVYDRNSIKLETLRKRDDLHRPVKLQFIKHYDQRRPPIYRPRGMIIRNPFSYMRIKEVISYDNDSSEGWEECENDSAMEMSGEDLSESSGGSDAGSLVSEDSSNSDVEEPKKRLKKPVFIYSKVPVVVYFEADKYLNAPLVPSSDIPLEICQSLNELKNGDIPMGTISELYNIEEGALFKYYGHS